MKTFVSIVLFVLLVQVTNAQVVKSEIKNYTYSSTDKYNPRVATLLAVFPGAGHFYCGKIGRGLLFEGGLVATFGIFTVGSLNDWSSQGEGSSGGILMALGGGAFIGLYVLNFFDAEKTAKLRNIELRRKMGINVLPYYEINKNSFISCSYTGVSVRITF